MNMSFFDKSSYEGNALEESVKAEAKGLYATYPSLFVVLVYSTS